MLAKDVKIVDLDPAHVEHAFSLFGGEGDGNTPPTLIVFYRENRLVHAVHSDRGPLEGVSFRGPRNLEEMARENGVERVLCLETGALRRLASNAQARLRYDQSLWDQALACKAAAKTEMGAGIHIYPDPFQSLPTLPDIALKSLRWLLPRRALVPVAVFDGDTVWTSAIVGAAGGEVNLLTTTDSLDSLDVRNRTLSAKADAVNRAVTARWGKPTAGFYMERVALEQIVTAAKPLGVLARLAKERWIVVSPFPPRMKILLSLARILKF